MLRSMRLLGVIDVDKKKLNTSETLLLIASELNEEGDKIRGESSGKDPTTLDFIIDTAVAETLFEVARNLIELVEERLELSQGWSREGYKFIF